MEDFYLGDPVVAIRDGMWGDIQKGEVGTVISFYDNSIGVDWGREVPRGHNCSLPEYSLRRCCTWVRRVEIQHDSPVGDEAAPDIMDII